MLREELYAFAQNDDDMGCIPSLEMTIALKDNTPVRRSYTSIPKSLYRQVKEYIEDLLANPNIPTQPLLLCMKKDGSLMLCIDYRILNQQTIPN